MFARLLEMLNLNDTSHNDYTVKQNKKEKNPDEFYYAIKAGDENAVGWFLRNGADCDQRDCYYKTPLSVAIENSHLGVILLLLEAGADVNNFDHDSVISGEPLRHAYALTDFLSSKRNRDLDANEIKIISLLLQYKASLTWTDSEDNTPLNLALYINGQGKYIVVKMLLEAGLDINEEDYSLDKDGTPLTIAVQEWNEEGVQCLLENKADVNKTYLKKSPLQIAAKKSGSAYMMSLLLEAKADIDYQDTSEPWAFREKPSALQIAVENNRIPQASMLLEKKADPNCFDNLRTPIRTATDNNSQTLANLLLDHGAKPCRESYGTVRTPLHSNNKAIVNMIKASSSYANTRVRLLAQGLFNKLEKQNENIISIKNGDTYEPLAGGMKEDKIYKQDRGEEGVRVFWVEQGHRCLMDFTKEEIAVESAKSPSLSLR